MWAMCPESVWDLSDCSGSQFGFDSRRLHQPSLASRASAGRPARRVFDRAKAGARRSPRGEGGRLAFRIWQISANLTEIQNMSGSPESINKGKYYAYILESLSSPGKVYRGFTSDLESRLRRHNQGKCKHTAKHRPWKLKVYIAFDFPELARDFERYLKSGSGRAFAAKHFQMGSAQPGRPRDPST